MSNKAISILEIIIESYDYNVYVNKHFNNGKRTNGSENILCPHGINKCKRMGLINH